MASLSGSISSLLCRYLLTGGTRSCFPRPFLFTDVNNLSLAFEGIQTFILLILTLFVIVKVGLTKFFRILLFNKDVSAFFLFALLFGVTIGLTSYNFGALSRYKIPSIPFFTAVLTIIYYLGYLKKKLQSNSSRTAIIKVDSN